MDTSKKTIIDWPYSKDSENIAEYFKKLEYAPEKTDDILKYFENLEPKRSLENNSGLSLKRSLSK